MDSSSAVTSSAVTSSSVTSASTSEPVTVQVELQPVVDTVAFGLGVVVALLIGVILSIWARGWH